MSVGDSNGRRTASIKTPFSRIAVRGYCITNGNKSEAKRLKMSKNSKTMKDYSVERGVKRRYNRFVNKIKTRERASSAIFGLADENVHNADDTT